MPKKIAKIEKMTLNTKLQKKVVWNDNQQKKYPEWQFTKFAKYIPEVYNCPE